MSVRMMAAIFETDFIDLPYPDKHTGEQKLTKASTAKLVLLALADHANDEGESAYPGYVRLQRKTSLSAQGIEDTLRALEYNGILTIERKGSKRGTNNYIFNLQSFPYLEDKHENALDITPKDSHSSHLSITTQATCTPPLKPLEYNHQVTVSKPSYSDEYKKRIAVATAQGIINSGKSRSNGANNWPPDVSAWGEAWMQLTQREALSKSQFAMCIKQFRELQARGIELEQFEQGYKAATQMDGMSVPNPLGCYYAADEIRQGKRNPDGSRKAQAIKPRRQVFSADA